LILADMAAEAKKADLRGFECVKTVHLEHELFSVENNMLTPTMKLV
jgi:long-chain acyl-CoA synthetase